MGDLTLPLKAEYFDAIRDGSKVEEFRLLTPYWMKRLFADPQRPALPRAYDRVVLTKGYPARDDHDRRLVRQWRGFTVRTITHPHFGPDPVEVAAIDVSVPDTRP